MTAGPKRRTPSQSRKRRRRPGMHSIRELAKEFGISSRTLRHYEDMGAVLPSENHGMRYYSRRERRRLITVLRGVNLGFHLAVIADFLTHVFDPPGKDYSVALDKVDQVTEELLRKRADVDAALRELRLVRPRIVAHIDRERLNAAREA